MGKDRGYWQASGIIRKRASILVRPVALVVLKVAAGSLEKLPKALIVRLDGINLAVCHRRRLDLGIDPSLCVERLDQCGVAYALIVLVG
jgi:hypothetical protein